jgi:hypothetical protein
MLVVAIYRLRDTVCNFGGNDSSVNLGLGSEELLANSCRSDVVLIEPAFWQEIKQPVLAKNPLRQGASIRIAT